MPSKFLGETLALLSFASSSQPERPPLLYASSSSHSEQRHNCCNLQQRPNSSAKLLQQSSEKYLDIVASARRSGQKDFQRGTRGTPPVSVASCSISPFFRACIFTEWSSTDHETDSTGTSILIPLLLLNFNMRLYGNPTACYLFLATVRTSCHQSWCYQTPVSCGRLLLWRP